MRPIVETVTLTLRCEEPPAFEAVSVYVVVALGVTVAVVPVTVPTPWSMVTAWAPVTAQLSVTGVPGGTLAADAVNAVIVGRGMGAQVPAVQASPLPHAVPSCLAVVGWQIPGAVGDAHASTPSRHGSDGAQGPTWQLEADTQDPLLQTRWSPQEVLSGLFPVTMHRGADAAVGQEVMPMVQPLSGWQGWLGWQEPAHVPALHTIPLPHVVPSGRLPVATHVGVASADAQVVIPVAQAFVRGWHGCPGAQGATQLPALHTLDPPHEVPSALLPVSVQTGVPFASAQVVVAVLHGFGDGQVTLATQVPPPVSEPPELHAHSEPVASITAAIVEAPFVLIAAPAR